MYWILSAVIAALLVFSIFQYSKMQSLKINIENNYNRAFHELVNYVDDIDTLLQKSMLVSSATQISTISSELFRQTTAAKACLGQLPISEVQLENTEKFLSQIGDFTYMLSQNSINNKDINEEEYKEFYHKVFMDYKDPLFWIHLNMDYPFNLKGILYFPKINTEYDSIEGKIKLYNNQVFIADNIKEVIPEFLMLLKGVIDCPDLPLNVSRSALQNDGFVKKIADYITKKVADKLSGMCKTDREAYEKYWDDISPFIKFGCLKDEKFCEKITDYVLFKNLDGKYFALPEALKVNDDAGKDADTVEVENADGTPATDNDDADNDAGFDEDERQRPAGAGLREGDAVCDPAAVRLPDATRTGSPRGVLHNV